MFRIHDAQMEFLNRRERSIYLQRLQAYLQSNYPECFDEMTADEVREWIAQAIAICDKFGMKTEFAATQLVLLLLVLGTNATDKYTWFLEVVNDRDLSAEGKLRLLFRRARAENIEGVNDVMLDASWEAT